MNINISETIICYSRSLLFSVPPRDCDVARLRLCDCDARDVSDAGDACPSPVPGARGGAEL